jgi:hypothetical protein
MNPRPILLALAAFAFSCAPLHARKQVVAYVPNWIDLRKFASTIDYQKITHLNIAFENPVDDTGGLSFNPANRELIRLARAAKVKVLVSIGGGSGQAGGGVNDEPWTRQQAHGIGEPVRGHLHAERDEGRQDRENNRIPGMSRSHSFDPA